MEGETAVTGVCFPESGRSNRSREFHFQFPNCGIVSASLGLEWRGKLLVLEELDWSMGVTVVPQLDTL